MIGPGYNVPDQPLTGFASQESPDRQSRLAQHAGCADRQRKRSEAESEVADAGTGQAAGLASWTISQSVPSTGTRRSSTLLTAAEWKENGLPLTQAFPICRLRLVAGLSSPAAHQADASCLVASIRPVRLNHGRRQGVAFLPVHGIAHARYGRCRAKVMQGEFILIIGIKSLFLPKIRNIIRPSRARSRGALCDHHER
jgi:hypothetical protein